MDDIERLIKVLEDVRDATRAAHVATKDAQQEAKRLRQAVKDAKDYEKAVGQDVLVPLIESLAEGVLDQFVLIVNEAVKESENALRDRYNTLIGLLEVATSQIATRGLSSIKIPASPMGATKNPVVSVNKFAVDPKNCDHHGKETRQ